MSLLSVLQNVSARQNLPTPTTVMGASDPQVLQMRRLLEEVGNDLALRGDWTELIREAALTTVATESQGLMTTLANFGFRHIKNGTFWDRTNKLPILGPLNDQQWQGLKGMATTGPRYHFRIRGGTLLVNPTPTAGHAWVFEYASKYWITNADGNAFRQFYQLDTDQNLLSDDLLMLGLTWRWLKAKGLDYAEEFRTYEHQVKDALGRDGGKSVLSMDGGSRDARPGIFVSPMSWDLP